MLHKIKINNYEIIVIYLRINLIFVKHKLRKAMEKAINISKESGISSFDLMKLGFRNPYSIKLIRKRRTLNFHSPIKDEKETDFLNESWKDALTTLNESLSVILNENEQKQ